MSAIPPSPKALPPVGRAGRRALVWLLLAFIGSTGVVAAWLLCRSPQPVKLPEVPRSELVLRGGCLFRGAETNSFTGLMVEFYKTNQFQSRSMISNGLLQGLSEGWHTNGQLQIREYFNQGISDGLRTKWYPNGTRMSEGFIVNGKHNGKFRRWHENGALADEIEIRDGIPDGLSKSFYPSGFLKAQARMTNGQPTDQKFWNDGEKKSTDAQ